MAHRAAISMALLLAVCPAGSAAAQQTPPDAAIATAGIRQLPEYEADVYGPTPFPEEVTSFLHHELSYILSRQKANGSWDSAEPLGRGRTRPEAGGTVGNVILTSMCGDSLRRHVEIAPQVHGEAIGRARRFVTHMVLSGKLHSNEGDGPWQLIYALRFLVAEYPRVENPAFRKDVEDACAVLVLGLRDCQGGTPGELSTPFSWDKRSNPGLMVGDTDKKQGVVLACDPGSPAHAAGIRVGDVLLAANGSRVDTAARYAMAELTWLGGDTIRFMLSRRDKPLEVRVKLPRQYPGTLGLDLREDADGVSIAGFDFLSNRELTLRVGDRIRGVEGRAIARKEDVEKLTLFAGQTVTLQVQRDGKDHEIATACAPVAEAAFGMSFPRGPYDQSIEKGLRIGALTSDSCLKAAGLRPGDRLLRLDGSLLLDRQHYRELSRSLWGGKKVRVTFLSRGRERHVEVPTRSRSNAKWLTGYHGLEIGKQAVFANVVYGSPAEQAGCKAGDRLLEINGVAVKDQRQAKALLTAIAAGKKVALVVGRGSERREIGFAMNRRGHSLWTVRRPEAGGGWGYLASVRGGNSFTTADALRELLKAKRAMPELEVPDEMLRRAFLMLGKLRKKQPNGGVESYRYDTAGSFWRYADIRADVGRLNSVELACVMYTDAGLKDGGDSRTQRHLEKALEEWLKHRGILDLVKFPAGHGELSIAPYFWMYSYRTTLEAAAYLTVNDELQEAVRRMSLKAFFQHMRFYYEPQLQAKGWIIGDDKNKELHDSCQLLDALATIKHLYRPRLEVENPVFGKALEAFHLARYGDAHQLIRTLADEDRNHAEARLIEKAIADRYRVRVAELEAIHRGYPRDALRYLEETKPRFRGHPKFSRLESLAAEWSRTLPPLPKWFDLGLCPGAPAGESSSQAWERVFALKSAAPPPAEWSGFEDLLASADPTRDAVAGKWRRADGQLISPEGPYARLQLGSAPKGSYRLETQFTRLRGHCVAVMFPAGKTAGLLVVGGWAGKVSGIAYINGRDADRNATTRDGKFSSHSKHSLELVVRLLDGDRVRIAVRLDGKPYLNWEGNRSALRPDRAWRLRRAGAIGIGSYNTSLVFHHCRLQKLDE